MSETEEQTTQYDYLVVVPTVGERDVLIPSVHRMIRHMDARTLLVLSVNPLDQQAAGETLTELQSTKSMVPDGCAILVTVADGPLGFAKAVNMGLEYGLSNCDETPAIVIVVNDDVMVTPGWQQGLRGAFETETIRLYGEPASAKAKPDRAVEDYGKVGLVGPASDNVAGVQFVPLNDAERQLAARDPDGYAAQFRTMNPGNYMTCDFLSGFCLALSKECFNEVVQWTTDVPGGPSSRVALFDERFGIGGFEDNDLCVRAERKGWRCLVAGDTFVHHRGHMTMDRHFDGQKRGLANRLTYYEKWAALDPPDQRQRLVACYRIGWRVANDLHLTRGSLIRTASVSDGVAVVLTVNPLEITAAFDFASSEQNLTPDDKALLDGCKRADAADVAKAFTKWIEAITATSMCRPQDVRVEVWGGDWNERDERNRAIALAEELEPDWIMSVDHDEVLEDRLTRAHFERWMSHPDPMVRTWDFGWLNHWDSTRLCRVDPPWSDGTTFATGMRGFRLWRSNGRRIQAGTDNGLHCGNSPDHCKVAKRISAARFRHYGYVRVQDRIIKQRQYQELDKNPDVKLTGNLQGYSHLTNEEGMMLSPYVAINGVGLTMLLHAREDVEDLARWLDFAYGLADRIVLVWTDTDHDAPTPEFEQLGRMYGVEWIRHEFDMDLAACRNAGVARLREAGDIGWAWVIDPDEWLEDAWQMTAIRRMAENSDSYGFMMRFANHRPPATGEGPTISESVRLFRLDPNGAMVYSGRVHEGFDLSISLLTANGVHPQIRYAPFITHHRGLAGDDAEVDAKLRKYTGMLLLELHDNPGSPAAWTSLGLQYANEDRSQEAYICYDRAVQCAGTAYLPYKEMALWHLRHAKDLYRQVVERVVPSHSYHEHALAIEKWLEETAPGQPIVGMARKGETDSSWLPDVTEFIEELQKHWQEKNEATDDNGTATEADETPVDEPEGAIDLPA